MWIKKTIQRFSKAKKKTPYQAPRFDNVVQRLMAYNRTVDIEKVNTPILLQITQSGKLSVSSSIEKIPVIFNNVDDASIHIDSHLKGVGW